MLNGFAIQVHPYLVGCKRAVSFDGRTIQVSPAFWDLLKYAKTAKETEELLRSLMVLNFGPKMHDEQWLLDTMQILNAQMEGRQG